VLNWIVEVFCIGCVKLECRSVLYRLYKCGVSKCSFLRFVNWSVKGSLYSVLDWIIKEFCLVVISRSGKVLRVRCNKLGCRSVYR